MTVTPAEPLIKGKLKAGDQCAAVRDASGPPWQSMYFSGSFVFDRLVFFVLLIESWELRMQDDSSTTS